MHDSTIRSLIGLIIAILSVCIIYNVIKKLRKMKDSLYIYRIYCKSILKN